MYALHLSVTEGETPPEAIPTTDPTRDTDDEEDYPSQPTVATPPQLETKASVLSNEGSPTRVSDFDSLAGPPIKTGSTGMVISSPPRSPSGPAAAAASGKNVTSLSSLANLSPTATETTLELDSEEDEDDQFVTSPPEASRENMSMRHHAGGASTLSLPNLDGATSSGSVANNSNNNMFNENASVCSSSSQATVKISNKSPGRESGSPSGKVQPRPARLLYIPTAEDLQKSNEEEVERLKNVAKKLAARGKEVEAIRVYHRALRLMKQDSSRIKKGLRQEEEKKHLEDKRRMMEEQEQKGREKAGEHEETPQPKNPLPRAESDSSDEDIYTDADEGEGSKSDKNDHPGELKEEEEEEEKEEEQPEPEEEEEEEATKLQKEWMKLASSLAEIRTIMAILYERLGEYDKALSSCDEAKQMYSSYGHLVARSGLEATDTSTQVQQMEAMHKKLKRSKDTFAARKGFHEEAIEWRRQVLISSTLREKEQYYKEAFIALKRALSMERAALGARHPQVADTICMFGTMFFERGQMDEAIYEFSRASQILKNSLGSYHPRTALAMRSLARAFETRQKDKDLEQAIKYYSEACECFREAYGTGHGMVGATLNNIAVIYIQLANYNAAVDKLSDALNSYESVIAIEEGSMNADASQVWKNLGECYGRRREWENAHFAYMSALEVQRDARKSLQELGANQSLLKQRGCDDTTLADTLLRLGRATKETGRHEESYHLYKEALFLFKIQYRAAQKRANGRKTLQLVEFQDRLAHSLYCIAETQEILGKYDDAIKIYSESLNLRLSSDAERTGGNMNMIHCAMALAGIGSVHMKKKEHSDAVIVYKESVSFLDAHGVPQDHELQKAIRGRLKDAERGAMGTKSFDSEESMESFQDAMKNDRTIAMDLEAQKQMQAKQYDDAIVTLTQVLAIRRKRLTKRQLRMDDRTRRLRLKEKDAVARTLGNFATVLKMKGEKKQATMLFEEAIRVYLSNGLKENDPLIYDLRVEVKKLPSFNAEAAEDTPINLVEEERIRSDDKQRQVIVC